MLSDNKEILMIVKGGELLANLKMISNFPKAVERIKSKISSDKLKLIILQNSRNKNYTQTQNPTARYDR